MSHHIHKCKCGNVLSQCRCINKNKQTTITKSCQCKTPGTEDLKPITEVDSRGKVSK